MTTKSNIQVDYDDSIHKYYLKDRVYRSATQIIEQMHRKFDVDLEAHRMTLKYGHTVQFWKSKWAEKRDTACDRGNMLHNRKEEFLYGRGFDRIHGKDFPVQNVNLLQQHINYFWDLPDGIYPELTLWDHHWGIAGRADKPTIETIGSSRYMHIEDYKTNEKIMTMGWIEANGNERMMYPPISHLPDCEKTHYSLQLSFYQYMGEYFGFKPGKRRLIHFPHEIEGLGTPSPKPIELPYLKDEVIAILTHLKALKWLN